MSAAVVMLPTAAPRKVRNSPTRARRASAAALPQFPRAKCMTPWERDAFGRAKRILQMSRTPELAIATAIFMTLDEMQKLRVQASVAMMGEQHTDTSLQASAWLECFSTYGATSATKRALERLLSGEGQ